MLGLMKMDGFMLVVLAVNFNILGIMTLEEAITHCKEKACDNTQCALEHRQLAEWLQELQQYRKNTRKEDK